MKVANLLNAIAVASMLLVTVPSEVDGQHTAPDPGESALRALVAAPSPAAEDRAAIRDFLARDEVRDAATSHGIDLDRARQAAATLDDEAASDLAERIRTLQDGEVLAGGDRVVISGSVILIVLLLLILIAI